MITILKIEKYICGDKNIRQMPLIDCKSFQSGKMANGHKKKQVFQFVFAFRDFLSIFEALRGSSDVANWRQLNLRK